MCDGALAGFERELFEEDALLFEDVRETLLCCGDARLLFVAEMCELLVLPSAEVAGRGRLLAAQLVGEGALVALKVRDEGALFGAQLLDGGASAPAVKFPCSVSLDI